MTAVFADEQLVRHAAVLHLPLAKHRPVEFGELLAAVDEQQQPSIARASELWRDPTGAVGLPAETCDHFVIAIFRRLGSSALATIRSAISRISQMARKYIFCAGSGDDIAYYPAFDVRQPEIAARVTERELLVVEAQQMQQGRMQVVHVDLVLDGKVS